MRYATGDRGREGATAAAVVILKKGRDSPRVDFRSAEDRIP